MLHHRMYSSSIFCRFRRYFDKYFLESLRFAPPELPLKFAGVRQATSFGAACPQQAVDVPGGAFNFSAIQTSEDCRSASYILLVFLTNM